jgi:hypothetical protein
VQDGTNQSPGLKPAETSAEHKELHSLAQHLSPTSSVVVPFQVADTCVVAGATIQAVPPALQITALLSGNTVPTGQEATNAVSVSGVSNHQSTGPIVIPIFLNTF